MIQPVKRWPVRQKTDAFWLLLSPLSGNTGQCGEQRPKGFSFVVPEVRDGQQVIRTLATMNTVLLQRLPWTTWGNLTHQHKGQAG